MEKRVTDDMRDPATPPSVDIRSEARAPTTDPTVGQPLALAPLAPARHRLVTLGDSLTHGFQSGAIFNTDLSFARIIAWEMGWADQFRYPRYGGPGGLPLNIEHLVRHLERGFGDEINWWELAPAALSVRSWMGVVEDYWERGPGSVPPDATAINHNLAVYGWDVRDALSRTAGICARAIKRPRNDWLDQMVGDANDRAAQRVLPPLDDPRADGMSMLDAAEALGNDGGIETLLVFLGANNALGSVVNLNVAWSQRGDSGADFQDLEKKKKFTVWDPDHFKIELDELVARVKRINAARVIWGTVPHVTVAPLARGVGVRKVKPGSRYFPYYTRPWIRDRDFDPAEDKNMTAAQVRAVDSAIDQYNEAIVDAVRRARTPDGGGRGWFVLDTAGLLDRLATRRYIEDPEARPDWWRPYDLPPALQRLAPPPNARFFSSGPTGRTQGGLFSLDGVHPTTIAYGVLAQEFINVMQTAGVTFFEGDGETRRPGPVSVDFNRLIALDTLISNPPRSLASDLAGIGWLDQQLDLFKRLF